MNFQKGAAPNVLEYPLSVRQCENLKPCDLASPMPGKRNGLLQPSALKGTKLEQAATEIDEVREMVERDEFPREFMAKYYPWGDSPADTPEILKAEGLSFDDPKGLANVVHMDNPMDFPNATLKYVLQNGGICGQANPDCNDFIEKVPETVRKLAQAVDRNLKKAFKAKYYFGVARPEEALSRNMTAYPEGCPTHPSFPAGHGAAAAAVSVLLKRFTVSADVEKQVRDAAYVWAMARSLAGVHYGLDNVAGLAMGGLMSTNEFNKFARRFA